MKSAVVDLKTNIVVAVIMAHPRSKPPDGTRLVPMEYERFLTNDHYERLRSTIAASESAYLSTFDAETMREVPVIPHQTLWTEDTGFTDLDGMRRPLHK